MSRAGDEPTTERTKRVMEQASADSNITVTEGQRKALTDQRAGNIAYDREVLVNVLVYHWRTRSSGCGCGWAELGHSWPEHVATVYEESVMARG